MSLSELKEKDVVNIENGMRVGKVMDIEFDATTGCVEALVVPGGFDFLALLRGERGLSSSPGRRSAASETT